MSNTTNTKRECYECLNEGVTPEPYMGQGLCRRHLAYEYAMEEAYDLMQKAAAEEDEYLDEDMDLLMEEDE